MRQGLVAFDGLQGADHEDGLGPFGHLGRVLGLLLADDLHLLSLDLCLLGLFLLVLRDELLFHLLSPPIVIRVVEHRKR